MQELIASEWDEYALLDTGNGQRLERFGKFVLSRPDPQAIWQQRLPLSEWNKADAIFAEGWVQKTKLPDKWLMYFNDLKFWAKLTPFKHTGVFPEQAAQWSWIEEKIKSQKSKVKNTSQKLKVLNLFGYTGVASLICAQKGAEVTHVDASKPAIGWVRENQAASGLSDKPIRWILDDAIKFTNREIKRGNKYDAIIMDPPVYGHGPNGEVWDFHKSLPQLLQNCQAILSEKPLFVLINAYAISASAIMLKNLLEDFFGNLGGSIEYGELVLQEENKGRMLSTGIFGRWSGSLK